MNITDVYQGKQKFNCVTLKALAADLVSLEVRHKAGLARKMAGYERLGAKYGTTSRTVKRVRKRMVDSGLMDAAIKEAESELRAVFRAAEAAA